MTAIPELAESEDEKIRKELLDFVRSFWADHKEKLPQASRWVTYLEKQKEQKPSYGIYWHAIKKGERLPCRAYIWDHNFEKYYDFWEGRLIPNMENISIGRDTWYLPADDVRDLPREGVDELLKGHNSDWNEEDEVYLQDALWCVEQAVKVARDENDMGACWSAERWLKSLSAKIK